MVGETGWLCFADWIPPNPAASEIPPRGFISLFLFIQTVSETFQLKNMHISQDMQ